MTKDKQIEEMAFNLIMATSPLGVKDLTKQFDYNTVATDLYELYGWRKASEVAREIFEEIDAHFDKRIALYQTMKSRALLVGNEVERKYADTMIINLTIYKKEIAELKKKYTEEVK